MIVVCWLYAVVSYSLCVVRFAFLLLVGVAWCLLFVVVACCCLLLLFDDCCLLLAV